MEDGDTHVHPLQDPLVVTQQAEQQPAAPLEDTDSNPIAAKRTKRNEEDKDQKDRAVVEETTRNGNSTCASTNTEQERVMVESTRKPESDSAETRSPNQKETWFDAVVKNHGHHPRHESFVVTSRDHLNAMKLDDEEQEPPEITEETETESFARQAEEPLQQEDEEPQRVVPIGPSEGSTTRANQVEEPQESEVTPSVASPTSITLPCGVLCRSCPGMSLRDWGN